MNIAKTVAHWVAEAPLTGALVIVSVLLTILTGFGSSARLLPTLLIGLPGMPFLDQVREGELWRLLTPIFLHFGPLHLLFNMIWLLDLGQLLEPRRGAAMLLTFVVVVGVGSNIAQYAITHSPTFGGMSGVVYGFLGYVWMQGKFNPHAGYRMHKHIAVMMLIWFVLCWSGLLGPIANWAHTAGLLAGVIWGFFDRSPNQRRRLRVTGS